MYSEAPYKAGNQVTHTTTHNTHHAHTHTHTHTLPPTSTPTLTMHAHYPHPHPHTHLHSHPHTHPHPPPPPHTQLQAPSPESLEWASSCAAIRVWAFGSSTPAAEMKLWEVCVCGRRGGCGGAVWCVCVCVTRPCKVVCDDGGPCVFVGRRIGWGRWGDGIPRGGDETRLCVLCMLCG